MLKPFFIAMSTLLLSACTSIGVEVANLPAKFSSNQKIADVVYQPNPQQKLDIYIPQHASRQSLPVVVFFYGGRWESGSKEMYAFLGDKLADRGFVAVIADYRKYPEVRFPVFVEDAAKAIAWVSDHIAEYGGNPDKLFVAGHSAGAHIGALVTADKRYLSALGKSNQIIKGFAGLSGPYDFVPQAEDLKKIFAPPENYPQMQVTTFIDGSEPPMLLLWGDADTEVWRRNLDLLTQKIQQTGGVVETKIYPGVGHVGILANQAWFVPGQATALEDLSTFFNKY
ncbi:MAG: alpha/beta hydrolase [Thiotrichales bacterium]|nr:alpha/beta hydrolase [Thiotrichales bacterium]